MTNYTPSNPSKKPLGVLLFLISIGMLILSIYKNQWGIADPSWFQSFQRDSEGLIIGRLVKSRQDGILSSSGLPGRGANLGVEGQYQAYLHQDHFLEYETYKSQIGLQGMVFSLLDKISPFEPGQNLRIFYGLSALLTALLLSAIILWFYKEFGLLAAVVVFISTLLSQWITVFGRNLWWSTWAFYLPMLIGMYLLARENGGKRSPAWLLPLYISLGVLVKTLFNGYEYMTTTLVMLAVPLLYYGIRRSWKGRVLFKRLLYVQVGSLLSIFISLSILAFQLSFIEGGYLNGVKYLIYTLGERTHGSLASDREIIQESLQADLLPVVSGYTRQVIIDLNNLIQTEQQWLREAFSIQLVDLCALFFLTTIFAVFLVRMKSSPSSDKRKLIALIIAMWFAILAPLSWFVIFKAHSYIHTHMNSITWHMPFTLFGFALIGFVIRALLTRPREELSLKS